MDSMTPEKNVLPVKEGQAGRLRLNRPQALHSLDRQMVRDMADALIEWRVDPDVRLILIDHAQGRGFCAGGDVVGISQDVAGHEAAARGFFFDEYRLNHLEYTYPKPGIAFMDGVTMGGGVGIACPRRYRRVEQHEVPALLQASYCLRDPLILQKGDGVQQNGTCRDDQKSRDDLIPKVLQGLTVIETAGKPDEVRFAEHPVQLRVFEVAVHDGGPPPHAGQGGSEAEADAGPPGARLGTGDDDATRPPHPQKVARQFLVVTPHW